MCVCVVRDFDCVYPPPACSSCLCICIGECFFFLVGVLALALPLALSERNYHFGLFVSLFPFFWPWLAECDTVMLHYINEHRHTIACVYPGDCHFALAAAAAAIHMRMDHCG